MNPKERRNRRRSSTEFQRRLVAGYAEYRVAARAARFED